MSEDKTKEMNDSRSFEERVFARFDAVDERFERIEGRLVNVEIKLSKLEERQYDTKPIWEQALAAIAELSARLDSVNTRLDSMEAKFDVRFDKLETDMDDGFRRVARKMEVLNDSFLEMQAHQRYLDRRLEKIEARENTT